MGDPSDPAVGFEAGDGILGLSGDTHADWTAAFGRLGPWTCVAASAAGHMHVREGKPRDDAFAIRSVGPWLAVAVADGAGSRPRSRYGASFAVSSLCEHLLRSALGVATEAPAADADAAPPSDSVPEPKPTRSAIPLLRSWPLRRRSREPHAPTSPPQAAHRQQTVSAVVPPFVEPPGAVPRDEAQSGWGTLSWRRERALIGESERVSDLSECVRSAFRAARAGLDSYAAQRGIGIRELHCTLLGVLLNTQTGAIGVGQIGDGLVSCLHPGMGVKPLIEPPSTGNVGETYVLTQSDWENYLAVRALTPEETAGIKTIYVMTDGVSEDCTHPPPEGLFESWSRGIDREMRTPSSPSAASVKLVRWLATYDAPASWDDRTLAVLLRQDPDDAAPPSDDRDEANE